MEYIEKHNIVVQAVESAMVIWANKQDRASIQDLAEAYEESKVHFKSLIGLEIEEDSIEELTNYTLKADGKSMHTGFIQPEVMHMGLFLSFSLMDTSEMNPLSVSEEEQKSMYEYLAYKVFENIDNPMNKISTAFSLMVFIISAVKALNNR
jgi:hypothetical protein